MPIPPWDDAAAALVALALMLLETWLIVSGRKPRSRWAYVWFAAAVLFTSLWIVGRR